MAAFSNRARQPAGRPIGDPLPPSRRPRPLRHHVQLNSFTVTLRTGRRRSILLWTVRRRGTNPLRTEAMHRKTSHHRSLSTGPPQAWSSRVVEGTTQAGMPCRFPPVSRPP
ncbi:hypothetical protein MSZK_28250 [Mycobacterium sp. shizuoka-1]|nr:hypothetical protein MSZK_28250 [Mycobacterium sp. shizuoka-1]